MLRKGFFADARIPFTEALIQTRSGWCSHMRNVQVNTRVVKPVRGGQTHTGFGGTRSTASICVVQRPLTQTGSAFSIQRHRALWDIVQVKTSWLQTEQ